MHTLLRSILILAMLVLSLTRAQAAIVQCEVANIIGNTWEYSYTVNNNSLATDIE